MKQNEMQNELVGQVVNFESSDLTTPFQIKWKGVFSLKNPEHIRTNTRRRATIVLDGEIKITTPKGEDIAVQQILFSASDIVSWNERDYFLIIENIYFTGQDSDDNARFPAKRHMLEINKDTGLFPEELKEIDRIRSKAKGALTSDEIAYLERAKEKMIRHTVEAREKIHTDLNTTKGSAGGIELF